MQENRLSMKQSTSTATAPIATPAASGIGILPVMASSQAGRLSHENTRIGEESHALATRVAHQAKERLGSTSYHFLRFVDCCYQNGVLTLRGRVPSFYLKQMAQSVLANLEGVDRIDNRVDVVSPRGLSSVR